MSNDFKNIVLFNDKRTRSFYLFVYLLFLFSATPLCKTFAQKSDTLHVNPGDYVIINDKLNYFEKDTILLQSKDSYYYKVNSQNVDKTQKFYNKVNQYLDEYRWGKHLSAAIFRNGAYTHRDSIKLKRTSGEFDKYKGKKVEKINVYRLSFLSSINYDDPDIKIFNEKLSKLTKSETKDKTILFNLFVHEGDDIDPSLISDSERHLRNLPFFQDARILVMQNPNNPDLVTLHVIAQEIWPFAFDIRIQNVQQNKVRIYDNNVFGSGQGAEVALITNYGKLPQFGYEGAIYGRNFFGTFINSNISHRRVFEDKYWEIDLHRNYFSSRTKYAGGINFQYNNLVENLSRPDTVIANQTLNYRNYDIWLSRSFLNKTSSRGYNHRIVFSTRYTNRWFIQRPSTSDQFNFELHDRIGYYGSIGYSIQDFYKSRLLYGFGTTEDLPVGALFELIGGWEEDEFFERPYGQINFSTGQLFKKFGYWYYKFRVGAYYKDKKLEQGIFSSQLEHASPLFLIGKYKTRILLKTNYMRGFNRLSDESIIINRKAIRGFKATDLIGSQRYSVNLEAVMFSNYYLYGFRMAFYAFADMGWIGHSQENILKNKMYLGYGFGIRSRNNNLAFNTLSVRFGFYPMLSDKTRIQSFVVEGEKLLKPNDFQIRKPELLKFE